MSRPFVCILVCVLAVALSGCAPTIDSSTTIEHLSAAGKAGVILRVDMMSDACLSNEVVLAHENGAAYKGVASVRQGDIWGPSGISRAELDPGVYHVVSITCQTANSRTALGKGTFGTFKQSYGRFEVRAGEIVNIGVLKLVFVGSKTVHLGVAEIPPAYMEKFRKDFPNLASRMETRLLELPSPKLSGAELQAYCARSTRTNEAFKLRPEPACLRLLQEKSKALPNMDPGRPALMQ